MEKKLSRPQALRRVLETTDCEDLKAYCEEELAKIKEKENKRKAKAKTSERAVENEELKERIVNLLTSWAPSAIWVEDIRKGLGEDWSRQKVTSMCTELVREGRISSEEINVPGVGKRVGYRV